MLLYGGTAGSVFITWMGYTCGYFLSWFFPRSLPEEPIRLEFPQLEGLTLLRAELAADIQSLKWPGSQVSKAESAVIV